MSEAAPERPRPQAVPARETPGGGNVLTKKVGPLPTWAWLGIIGIGGAAVWYFYKSRQANAAASSGTAAQSGNCTDTNGNSVPCDQVDYGGQIATLQTELQDLQGGEAGEGATTATTPPPKPPPGAGNPPPVTPPPGGAGNPPPVQPKPGVPGPVAGLRASKVTRTSVTLTWDRTAGATLYYVQLTYQSKTIASRTVATTSATFMGLRPDSSMHGHVSARNASGQGPTAQVAFHTPR